MNKNLNIGDILYRSKSMVEHAGIYLGEGEVLHNTPDNNVQITSFSEYSKGKTVKVVSQFLNSEQVMKLEKNVSTLLKQRLIYSLTTFNCEHLVSQLIDGMKKSPQIKSTAIGVATGALLATATNSKNPLWFALAGGLFGCTIVNTKRKYDFVI